MKCRLVPVLVASVCLLVQAGVAQLPNSVGSAVATPRFIAPGAIDVARVMAPPAAPDSAAGRADLDTVLEVQRWRTPEQVAWARLVDKSDFFADFGAGGFMGAGFDAAHHPKTAEFWRAVRASIQPFNEEAKKRFARDRPFVADPRVTLCIDGASGSGYPSGHALSAYLRAFILAEMFPERRDALMERARQIAWGRVIAGAHYPTDLEAGRRLAQACWSELVKNEAFQAGLAEVRAELAESGKSQTPNVQPQGSKTDQYPPSHTR